MARPLVSIMLPCFNAAESIRMALASVSAQTVKDWECIALDDGSTDGTWDVLADIAKRDPRVRAERFVENRGRGAARQRILELATGKYLAFLDSDDWMYPERLAAEARWLDTDARIGAVSACAAVTEGADRLIGLMKPKGRLPIVEVFRHPTPPPILFPTSMVRTDLAQATGFDPEFRRSQDSDFLIRALLGRHYALGSEVLYAYSQGTAASLERTLEGYDYRARAHGRHWRTHPVRVSWTLAQTKLKKLTYRVAGLLGADRRLIARRWGPADDETRRGFEAAHAIVRAEMSNLFAC